MPAYGANTQPFALYPGDLPGLSFNAEVISNDATAGERFSVSPASDGSLTGWSVEFTWNAAPAGTTVTSVEVSTTDVDGDYVQADSHTWSGSETVYRYDPAGYSARFVRAKVVTHDSGGHSVTAKVAR